MGAKVAARAVNWMCDAVERHYGIARTELLDAAGLDGDDFADPSARLPVEAVVDLLRFALARTGDPALGLRLAEAIDLRTQGFWGYAVLSCLTLGERIELQLRYLRLRAPLEFAFWIEGDRALLECDTSPIPPDLFPLIMDCAVAGTCIAHLAKLKPRPYELEVWLGYPEQPYHRELRALVGGPIVFAAPCTRIAFPARDLALRIQGDSHLGALMRTQLDAQLEEVDRQEQRGMLDEVRQRLLTRLGGDASLERIARDLRMSARSLRRQLSALGASFQDLLAEIRRERAVAYLAETNEAIEQVAIRLGYGDPSNFRRAFRRWTGVAPAVFRAQRRRRDRTAV